MFVLKNIQSTEKIQSDSFQQKLFSHPPCLLSQIAAVYISFFKVYLGYLIHWGNCMFQELRLPSTEKNGMANHIVLVWRLVYYNSLCISSLLYSIILQCITLAPKNTKKCMFEYIKLIMLPTSTNLSIFYGEYSSTQENCSKKDFKIV